MDAIVLVLLVIVDLEVCMLINGYWVMNPLGLRAEREREGCIMRSLVIRILSRYYSLSRTTTVTVFISHRQYAAISLPFLHIQFPFPFHNTNTIAPTITKYIYIWTLVYLFLYIVSSIYNISSIHIIHHAVYYYNNFEIRLSYTARIII